MNILVVVGAVGIVTVLLAFIYEWKKEAGPRAFVLMKRMRTSDLNEEAIDAATYYMQKQGGKTLPVKVQIDMTNYVAAGYYMARRKIEERAGLEDKKGNHHD